MAKEQAEQKGSIVRDPELQTMQKIQRLIEKLPDDAAKCRVIEWLAAKLKFPLTEKE